MTPRPSQDDDASTTFYDWTCPICGDSNRSISEGHQTKAMGLNSLKSHIRATEGEGHGDARSIPDGLDSTALGEHLEIRSPSSVD